MINFGKYRPRSKMLDLTPMIDVVFLLLIFFLLTSVSARPLLPLNLPETSNAQVAQEPEITVSLHIDGSIYLADKLITHEELPQALRDELVANAGTELSLRADRGVPFGDVVTVMDIAKKAGAIDIVVVTEVLQ